MGTWFDDNEDRIIYGRGHLEPIRCKHCFSTDVRWRQQGGKWVLFSLEPGKLHVCPIADEFTPEPEK